MGLHTFSDTTKVDSKRYFVRAQKGVTKGLKGHFLQAKRALFISCLVVFIN